MKLKCSLSHSFTHTHTRINMRLIPCGALWGSWAQGLSVSPISLIIGSSLHSPSMTFPEFQRVDSSNKVILGKGGNVGKGGDETTERQPRAALGQGPVSLSTDTISLSYFADTKIHSRWDPAQSMQPDPRVITPEGWWCRFLLTSPSEERLQANHALLL